MKTIWKLTIVGLAGIFALASLTQTAQAIPPFAKKHSLSCTDCHTAFPTLNDFGRDYKVRGYRLEDEDIPKEEIIADDLVLEKSFPLGVLVKGYAYDKRKDNDAKTRGLHEVEIFFGGNIYKNISIWAEIEAEDENDFSPGLEMGVLGFHFSPYFNVSIGHAPYFWNDPYDTLADWGRRMTRAHKAPLDVTRSYSSGVRLRSANQFISLYGKAHGLYYSVGYHRDLSDPEGEGGEDISGRAAFEFKPKFGNTEANISIGGFGVFGKQGGRGDEGLDFNRYGLDLQAEIGDFFSLFFVYLFANDELALATGVDEKNNSLYGELFWVFYNKAQSPSFVPLVRVENYERDDGASDYTDLTLNLSYFLTQNVKLSLEYWTNLSVPTGITKSNRITGFFTLLF
ncbi:MAG: hypothetical protein GTO16_03255 [Candidatus Aminicenantes bacterium]|nr:hypothetical protein [Candidatus Aminicenantes bacterium]